MKPFLMRWLVTTLAVLVVSQIAFVGVRADSLAALIVAGLFLGVLNAVVRPVLLLLSLPLLLLSMGLFFFVINALMLYLAGALISGFHVDGFGSALIGSILISMVSWIFSIFFSGTSGGTPRGMGGIRVIRMDGGSSAPARREPESRGATMKTVEGRVIDEERKE